MYELNIYVCIYVRIYVLMYFTDSPIDFLNHFRLVDREKVDAYARCFVVEDVLLSNVINCEVRGVRSVVDKYSPDLNIKPDPNT